MKAPMTVLTLGCVLTLFVSSPAMTHAATRIVALGDTGTGGCDQYKVARALKRWCTGKGCDYALLLGDNFYETGLSGRCSLDPQTGQVRPNEFRRAFTDPYGPAERLGTGQTLANCHWPDQKVERHDLDLWFYPVLGNHDYSHNNPGLDPFNYNRARLQWEEIDDDFSQGACTAASLRVPNGGKWGMDGSYYAFEDGNALFLALDTTPMVAERWMVWNGKDWVETRQRAEEYVQWQKTFVIDRMVQTPALWKIAFGHHPYVSNGPHGNAGTYDLATLGCSKPEDIADHGWACGREVKAFFAGIDSLCDEGLDLYLSGHDHSLQWLQADCGARKVEFIVSGAGTDGNKLTPVKDKNPDPAVVVRFIPAREMPGFVYLVINNTQIDVQLVDASTPETPRCIKRGTLTKTARGEPVRFAENTCI